MWRVALIVFSLLVLSSSAFAHEMIFGMQHKHDAHYYENLYRQGFERAKVNYTTTGDPRYMVPYLGWPNNNTQNTRHSGTITIRSGSQSSTRQR